MVLVQFFYIYNSLTPKFSFYIKRPS